MTDLDSEVWPVTARRVDGALQLGGLDVRDLAAEFGTPLYLLDEEDLRTRCRVWREAFVDGDVFYAGKAFLCVALVRLIAEEGLGLDVCTGGEIAVAERAGFPPERMVFHGNNKSVRELERAVALGIGRVVLDSFEEIVRLAHLAELAGIRQRVLIRVTPGVEAHTHEYVATGQEDQKFGFSLASGAAAEAARRVAGLPSLELAGLHAHIGSQIFDTQGFAIAAHRLVGLVAEIATEQGIELTELNLGGGLGIAYTSEDGPLPVAELAERLRAIVAKECAAAGMATPRIAVEPGRAIVGPTTVAVYEVGTVKDLPGLRTYVSVDGGMSDNIRTALYGAHYTAVLASRVSAADPKTVTVAGKHCESGDVLVSHVALPADLAPGDLLAIPASGAYQRSMASNYNHVPRPPVIAVRDGESRIFIRREEESDLLRLDAG
ncbi:MAG TPA: diaminopimelate decarboxylase [Mycobacteriales bacterium]|nr:diaminopimelate decarboxylase [Mycobacteriales bacterium]